MLVAIDPGVQCAGVAVFDSCSELAAAWLAEGDGWPGTAVQIRNDLVDCYIPALLDKAHIAIEVPQVYTQNKLKGDPNDLIDVALMVGCFAGLMKLPVTTYRPREWKGQIPKNIMVQRIQEKLSVEEKERVELPRAKGLQHNVWDAIGIGLFHERKRRGRAGTKASAD